MRHREIGQFSTTRVGLTKSNRWLTAILLTSFVVFGISWFVFVSGFFSIKQIQTNELNDLGREEVDLMTHEVLEQGRWTPWDKANLLFIDEKYLAEQLKTRLFAENVVVDKVYPNILRLMISERQRSVVLVSKDQMLMIDMSGLVTGDVDAGLASEVRSMLDGKLLADNKYPPVIVCNLPELATAGYQITDHTGVKMWIEAYRVLISSKMKFRYLELSEPTSRSLKMASEQGFKVIYDLGERLGPQIDTYNKFMQSKPKDLKVTGYIDVRVPGKIFVN